MNVVMTAPRLAPQAVALLEAAGASIHYIFHSTLIELYTASNHCFHSSSHSGFFWCTPHTCGACHTAGATTTTYHYGLDVWV